MIFKEFHMQQEFETLRSKNPKLANMLDIADCYITLEFNKEMVVTEVYRSEDEYKKLYAPDLSKMPAHRPHSKYEAVDLRSSVFTDLEIQKLLTFLHLFTSYGGQKTSAIYHQIAGGVFHFHVQHEI